MMKPQGAVTEKLANVIQALQLARKTGLLIVEHNAPNGSVEQGTVTLLNGQITSATFGVYQGSKALNLLVSWKPCYFVFQASPSTGPIPAQAPASQHSPTRTGPLRGPSASQQGGQGQPFPSPPAPRRLRAVDEVLPYFNQMGLTRAHRQIFLLVDGQRMLPELIRLVGRGPEEVEAHLVDLVRAGLIAF